MDQLAEWLLPIPEVRGSNPDFSEFYIETLFTLNWYSNEKTKIKNKRGREWHVLFKKNNSN